MGSQSPMPLSLESRLDTLVYDNESISLSPSRSDRLAARLWCSLLEVFRYSAVDELFALRSVVGYDILSDSIPTFMPTFPLV